MQLISSCLRANDGCTLSIPGPFLSKSDLPLTSLWESCVHMAPRSILGWPVYSRQTCRCFSCNVSHLYALKFFCVVLTIHTAIFIMMGNSHKWTETEDQILKAAVDQGKLIKPFKFLVLSKPAITSSDKADSIPQPRRRSTGSG